MFLNFLVMIGGLVGTICRDPVLLRGLSSAPFVHRGYELQTVRSTGVETFDRKRLMRQRPERCRQAQQYSVGTCTV